MHRALVPWWLTWIFGLLAVGRGAIAYPVQVLAATELQIVPRLAPDRTSLSLRVALRDDRGRPVAGRGVSLRLRVDAVARAPVTLSLGPTGEAIHTVPITRGERVVEAWARYEGDERTAPQESSVRVGLTVPYVTVDVIVPPGGIELGGPLASFVATLQVGEVVAFSPEGVPIELREGAQLLAQGFADRTGRVVLRVPPEVFGEPRVHRIRAVTSVDGERVEGPLRDVLVRARTVLFLVRTGALDDLSAPVSLEGVLRTVNLVPVPGASIRVRRGEVTLAGVRTEVDGTFRWRIPSELLTEHDVCVRASFEPTEPWYAASESAEVVLTGPAPPCVHWGWMVAPIVLAGGAVLVASLQARRRGGTHRLAARLPSETEGVLRLPGAQTGAVRGLHVHVVAIDRATARSVEDVCIRWGGSDVWVPVRGAVSVQPARRIEFEVGAAGYCPRKVTGEFAGPGVYELRVQLHTWREELFERARPWLRRGRAGATMPTLREALAHRAATPAARAFVEHVEHGCYALEAPTARDVARAEALREALDTDVPPLHP